MSSGIKRFSGFSTFRHGIPFAGPISTPTAQSQCLSVEEGEELPLLRVSRCLDGSPLRLIWYCLQDSHSRGVAYLGHLLRKSWVLGVGKQQAQVIFFFGGKTQNASNCCSLIQGLQPFHLSLSEFSTLVPVLNSSVYSCTQQGLAEINESLTPCLVHWNPPIQKQVDSGFIQLTNGVKSSNQNFGFHVTYFLNFNPLISF